MTKCIPGQIDDTARRWRRWLWETAETGAPCPGLTFNSAVYQAEDLCDLIGESSYVSLVDELVKDPDLAQVRHLARQVLDERFPSSCRCRTHADMGHDYLEFTREHVYRSLYFLDSSVTDHMRLLFHRTPELDLLECRECGDIWLRALDQVIWLQHLVLIEPADLTRIVEKRIWPTTLDRFEDAWVSRWNIVGRNSPHLRAWQAAHNKPEAFARFGE